MTKYRLLMDVTFETDKPVTTMEVKGTVEQVLKVLEGMDNPLEALDQSSDDTSDALFSIAQLGITPEQQLHGERIAARGRHNGTAEA